MEKKYREQKNIDWDQDFSADEYHNLKITQNLSAEQMGYQSENAVVPIGDIASVLDNFELSATAE